MGRRRNYPAQHDVAAFDDVALLLAAPRDPQAFAAFYRRHAQDVLAYFARRTADPETAADLTAETFAAVLAGLGRYDVDKGVPTAWLFGIAHNMLSQWLRRRQVERRARGKVAVDSVALDDYSASRIEAIIDAERARLWLEPALDCLSPALRQAVELRVMYDLSYEEVALRSGCSIPVARVRVCRALSQLSRSASFAAQPTEVGS